MIVIAPPFVNIFLLLMITSQFDQHEKIVRIILCGPVLLRHYYDLILFVEPVQQFMIGGERSA